MISFTYLFASLLITHGHLRYIHSRRIELHILANRPSISDTDRSCCVFRCPELRHGCLAFPENRPWFREKKAFHFRFIEEVTRYRLVLIKLRAWEGVLTIQNYSPQAIEPSRFGPKNAMSSSPRFRRRESRHYPEGCEPGQLV